MKIDIEQRKQIQDLVYSGISKTEVSKKYGLNLSTVYRILNKKSSKCERCNKEYFKTNGTMRWCSDKCRFWFYVDIKDYQECWPWTAKSKTDKDYGRFIINSKKSIMAPRFAYQDYYRTVIPNKLEIRHKCDNPSCCNPHHLELGTHKDNMQDASERKRIYNGKFIGCERYKVTQKDLEKMKSLHNQGIGYKTIQKEHFPNLHYTTIAKHIKGKISKPKS